MGCACGSGRRVVVFEVKRADGTVKRYLAQRDAEKDVKRYGGTWAQITQTGR